MACYVAAETRPRPLMMSADDCCTSSPLIARLPRFNIHSWKAILMYRLARLWFVVSLLSFVGALGCGGRSGTAQVSGRVLYKDGTVPSGGVCVVQFVPAGDSPAKIRKAASGEIQDDGWFEAYTRTPGDGVFLGKYDVTFAVWQGAMQPASLIDGKYTKASTTPYHITIDDDVSDLQFEIEPIQAKK